MIHAFNLILSDLRLEGKNALTRFVRYSTIKINADQNGRNRIQPK